MAKPTIRVRSNPRPMTEFELAAARKQATKRPMTAVELAKALEQAEQQAEDERYRGFLEAVQIAALEFQPPPTAKA
jgi:hypothetical protein